MKALIVADVHVGNIEPFGGKLVGGLNERCRATLAVLERAIAEGKRRGCDVGISAGDLVDSATSWPQIVAALRRVLVQSRMRWFLLRGNHEVRSASPGDDALQALVEEPMITVVEPGPSYLRADDEPMSLATSVFWAPFDFDWSSVEERAITRRLVVAHRGIAGDDTPLYLSSGVHARDIASKCDRLSTIVSGDWHAHRCFREAGAPNVFQVGALAPKNFGELGMDDYGWAGVFDSRNGYVPFRVTGPRFHIFESINHWRLFVATASPLRDPGPGMGPGDPCFMRVLYGDEEDEQAIFAELAAKLPPNTFQVLPAPRATKVVDTSKAAVATSAEQAVDRYVAERLKLPAGIDPAEFAAEAKRRLSNGRR